MPYRSPSAEGLWPETLDPLAPVRGLMTGIITSLFLWGGLARALLLLAGEG